MSETKVIVADVLTCPRCGHDHEGLRFARFKREMKTNGERQYWAFCPITLDPILMAEIEQPKFNRMA